MKSTKRWLTILLILILSTAPAYGATDYTLSDYDDILNVIDQHYYIPVDRQQLINDSYKGLFNSLDPYSTYMDAQEYAGFIEEMKGNYTGVGIVINPTDDGVEVVSVYNDSPAMRGGLQAGDLILTVNGTDLKTIEKEKMADGLLGPENTPVSITLKRGEAILTYTLIRGQIHIDPVEARIQEPGIGYIRILEFTEGTADEFFKAYAALKKQGMTKLILDLRNNPGGYLSEALPIADMFCPKGTVMLYEKSRSAEETAVSEETPYGIPLAVLVNGQSASASEILAGIIKANKTGTLVGTKTFGKGVVQTTLPLNDGKRGAVKMTVAEYFVTGHTAVHKVGILPDVVSFAPVYIKPTVINSLIPITENAAYGPGESGLNVLAAEQRLNLLGYTLKADGLLDPDTLQILSFKNLLTEGRLTTENVKNLHQLVIQASNPKQEDVQLKKAIEVLQ